MAEPARHDGAVVVGLGEVNDSVAGALCAPVGLSLADLLPIIAEAAIELPDADLDSARDHALATLASADRRSGCRVRRDGFGVVHRRVLAMPCHLWREIMLLVLSRLRSLIYAANRLLPVDDPAECELDERQTFATDRRRRPPAPGSALTRSIVMSPIAPAPPLQGAVV